MAPTISRSFIISNLTRRSTQILQTADEFWYPISQQDASIRDGAESSAPLVVMGFSIIGMLVFGSTIYQCWLRSHLKKLRPNEADCPVDPPSFLAQASLQREQKSRSTCWRRRRTAHALDDHKPPPLSHSISYSRGEKEQSYASTALAVTRPTVQARTSGYDMNAEQNTILTIVAKSARRSSSSSVALDHSKSGADSKLYIQTDEQRSTSTDTDDSDPPRQTGPLFRAKRKPSVSDLDLGRIRRNGRSSRRSVRSFWQHLLY